MGTTELPREGNEMNYLILTYVIYGASAVALTGVLARTLHANGAVFLETVFDENPAMAMAINRLLVTGFYMLNLGYGLLIFQMNEAETALGATEALVTKLGLLLVSLGVIHFINMAVFWKIRRSGDEKLQTPTMPSVQLPPPPATAQPVAPGR